MERECMGISTYILFPHFIFPWEEEYTQSNLIEIIKGEWFYPGYRAEWI